MNPPKTSSTVEVHKNNKSLCDVYNYRNDRDHKDYKYGLVVIDFSLQPENPWHWVYCVYGRQLVSCHSDKISQFNLVSDEQHKIFAIRQYHHWLDIEQGSLLKKIEAEPFEELIPTPNCTCGRCNGDRPLHYAVGSTAQYQGGTDQVNYSDVCSQCMGRGVVEDIYTL